MKVLARRCTPDGPLVHISALHQESDRAGRAWSPPALFTPFGGKELTARFPDSKKHHYALKKSAGGTGDGGPGEGITHELAKAAIAENKEFKLRVPIGILHFEFESFKIEETIHTAHGQIRVDMLGILAPDSPLIKQCGTREIAIEVCDTHPVGGKKVTALRDANIPTVEIILDKFWHVADDEAVSDARLAGLLDGLKTHLLPPRRFQNKKGQKEYELLHWPDKSVFKRPLQP